MRATVTARIASTASAISRPASAASRCDSCPPAPLAPPAPAPALKALRSAPAENDRPRPSTTTTFTDRCASNHRAASAISNNVVVLNGLSLSGRFSDSRPFGPSACTSMVVSSMVGTVDITTVRRVPKMTALDELFVHQIPEPLPVAAIEHQHWRESYFFVTHGPSRHDDVVI